MNRLLYGIVLLISLGLFSSTVYADDIPNPQRPYRLVNDFAGVLNQQETHTLEKALRDYNDTTGTQICVVIVSSLNDYDIADYTDRLGEKWRVGQKSLDNGVIILVKPKIGVERGYARLSVGYGLEEKIPDATSKHIVDDVMIPYFQNGDYFGGIASAVNVIIEIAAGTYQKDKGENSGKEPLIVLLIIIILFFVILGRRRGGGSDNISSGRKGDSNILTWVLLGSMLGGNGGSGSFGGGGGGSLGGFGGFGGGSFGGGGASGSW